MLEVMNAAISKDGNQRSQVTFCQMRPKNVVGAVFQILKKGHSLETWYGRGCFRVLSHLSTPNESLMPENLGNLHNSDRHVLAVTFPLIMLIAI